MNLYILVEGRRTEKKVYPKWLSYLIPELSQVDDPFDTLKNNFYLFNGNGYPSLLDNHLRNSIDDINSINRFNYLMICLDSDDEEVEVRKNEIYSFMRINSLQLDNCKLIIVVQNKCIESWFLGNRNVYSSQPHSQELRNFNQFYNVKHNDPELMNKMSNFNTSAQFHETYLSEMLLEKNVRYTKKNPNSVVERYYLEELISRHNDTNHISTFGRFIQFCSEIRKEIALDI